MKTYKRVPAPTSTRRSFAITCGLQEGYGSSGKLHTQDEVVAVAAAWMLERAKAGKTFLSGAFASAEVVYAWGGDNPGSGHEPILEFRGEISPLYAADLSDEEAKRLLEELATALGSACGQTRIYLAYCQESWVIQAEESATPTGEKV